MKKVKKGKYRFLRRSKVKMDRIFINTKPELQSLVEKYHCGTGNPLSFVNSPIARFAQEYVKNPEDIQKNYREHPFVMMSCERYACYEDAYRRDLLSRISSVVDSIRSHGYASGKYTNKLVCLVRLAKGRYEIISGKHRAAGCFALGMDEIDVFVYVKI